MRPAFDSNKQAAAFVLLLLVILAAPRLAGRAWLPPREQAYASEGWRWGPYPWLEKQIFDETNTIDIAFIGASRINFGIDTPYVQQKLDEQLGRKTVLRSLCWAGGGFDNLYYATRDLLAHREVKVLVFCDETTTPYPNARVSHWFRYGDDAAELSGLPLRDKSIYYFAAMVGMPRNLAELLTPNLPEETNNPNPNFNETAFHADNPEKRLGSLNARMMIDPVLGAYSAFAPYTPGTGVTPADLCIFNPTQATKFEFSKSPLPAWETHFARLFGLLAKKHGTKLVLVHLPMITERDSPVIAEPCYWPEVMQTDLTMMGIPTRRLFAGLSETELDRLYFDARHFNLNGQTYFTPLITPALLKIYESLPAK